MFGVMQGTPGMLANELFRLLQCLGSQDREEHAGVADPEA